MNRDRKLIEAWARAFFSTDSLYGEKYKPRYLDGFIKLEPIKNSKVSAFLDTIADKPGPTMAEKVESYRNYLRPAEPEVKLHWKPFRTPIKVDASDLKILDTIMIKRRKTSLGPFVMDLNLGRTWHIGGDDAPPSMHGETCVKCKKDCPDAIKVEKFTCWACKNGY